MGLAGELRRYAFFACANILSRLSEKDVERVKSAILFGSVARGTATAESDVDLFFDTDAPARFQKELRAKINRSVADWYLSNLALDFKLRGVSNDISVKVGRLEEWIELARSIASEGIVLYGRYTAKPPALIAYTVLSWEKPGKSKGALLNKFYGYRAGRKRYPGLLKKKNGIKLGKATIMVLASDRDAFIKVLEKYEIDYSRRDVWG